MTYGQRPGENGPKGFGPPFPRPPYWPPRRGKSWPARQKAFTGILAFVGLIIVAVATSSCGSSPSTGSGTTAVMTTTAAAAAAAATPAGTPSRPATVTPTGTPSHRVTHAAAPAQTTHPTKTKTATATIAATSQAPEPPAPAPTTPAAVVPPPSSAAPASCYPLTNGGNCYEPGEFCRNSDHGVSGMAGDGEAITCEDNNGWRWEPS